MNKREIINRLSDGESALELSIEKWENLICNNIDQNWFELNCSGDHCGLCVKMSSQKASYEYICDSCPITMNGINCNLPRSYWCRLRSMAIDSDSFGFNELKDKFIEFLKSLRGK